MREIFREIPPSSNSEGIFAAPRAAHRAEPLAQGGCGYFKLFCPILSPRWQLRVNRCLASARRIPRLIIRGQAPARLMGALNRLVYLDWPDLRDMTHIPAPKHATNVTEKPPPRQGTQARSPRAAAPGDRRNCLAHGESPLGSFLKIMTKPS